MDLAIVLDAYARGVFRDEADADYIAARSNFRLQLRQQFLWSAQQAVEKYLKAILLFNGKSARFVDMEKAKESPRNPGKEYGHKLDKLLEAVKEIPSFEFDAGGELNDKFLAYLGEQGPNRYISESAYTTQDSLELLDSTIWHVRRYCQNFECSSPALSVEQQAAVRQAAISMALDPQSATAAHLFRLAPGQGGYLEKILSKRNDHPAGKALVWANRFYGARKRGQIRYRVFSASAIPPHERYWWPTVDCEDIGLYVKLK